MSNTPMDSRTVRAFPIYSSGATPAEQRALALKHRLRELHAFMLENVPDCREKSVALTELESSGHWAVKAIFAEARD